MRLSSVSEDEAEIPAPRREDHGLHRRQLRPGSTRPTLISDPLTCIAGTIHMVDARWRLTIDIRYPVHRAINCRQKIAAVAAVTTRPAKTR